MRVLFMGTADFALPALERLHHEPSVELALVLSQPPRPAGRGHRDRRTPVHEKAIELGLAVETPVSLQGPEIQARLAGLESDLAIVAAYGLLLPRSVLDTPRLGCINVHGSLLPRWRGAAPVERAIMAGDSQTGVCLFQMEKGLDTGDVFVCAETGIGPHETGPDLRARLAELGADLLTHLLPKLADGSATATPQASEGATYAHKIERHEFEIDWHRSAVSIQRQIRAFHPQAWTTLGPDRLRVLSASFSDRQGPAGQVVLDPLTVACGAGALCLETIQMAGKKAMASTDFLRGRQVPVGTMLGSG